MKIPPFLNERTHRTKCRSPFIRRGVLYGPLACGRLTANIFAWFALGLQITAGTLFRGAKYLRPANATGVNATRAQPIPHYKKTISNHYYTQWKVEVVEVNTNGITRSHAS